MTKATLLLLPGLLCDDVVWTEVARSLTDVADCHVPAWGLLDSIGAMAQHALDTAPAGPLAIAGHSMGGRVALEILRRAPHRVARLALLDSGLDPLAEGEPGERERAQRMALLQIARTQGMRAMGRQWARGMVHPERLDTPVFERILAMIESKTPDAFEAQVRALLGRPDARKAFAGAQGPVLLACGRQDAWSPLARHEQMQALRPASRLVVIEDAGHMAPMEQPAAVAQALRDWLAQA